MRPGRKEAEMANVGYIKLHRRILEWRYYTDHVMLSAWIWLLLHANWQETSKNGNAIHVGEVALRYKDIMSDIGLSKDQVYRAIVRLKEDGAIMVRTSEPPKGATSFVIVTICKWEEYQGEIESQRDNRRDNRRDNSADNGKEVSPHTPLTRNRREEIRKKEKPSLNREGKKKVAATASDVSFCSLSTGAALEEKRRLFSTEVYAHGGKYAAEMVDAFIGYWTQTVGDGDVMAWEIEKQKRGFSVEARLKKWVSNDWKTERERTRRNPNAPSAADREVERVSAEQRRDDEDARARVPEGYTVGTWMLRLRTLRDKGNEDAALLMSKDAATLPLSEIEAIKARLI